MAKYPLYGLLQVFRHQEEIRRRINTIQNTQLCLTLKTVAASKVILTWPEGVFIFLLFPESDLFVPYLCKTCLFIFYNDIHQCCLTLFTDQYCSFTSMLCCIPEKLELQLSIPQHHIILGLNELVSQAEARHNLIPHCPLNCRLVQVTEESI